MTDLLLHPNVEKQLQTLTMHPVQSLLFIGPEGSGKGTLADFLFSGILLPNQGQQTVMHIDAATEGGIESARAIQKFLVLTTAGSAEYRRAVLIENSDYLTREAQNALLKTLEEPPEDTLFVLTARQTSSLLPTILSRVQKINLRPPSLSTVKAYYSTKLDTDAEKIERAYKISRGSIGAMRALVEGDVQNQIYVEIDEAKTILASGVFERLLRVEELVKDKKQMAKFLDSLLNISRAALHNSLEKDQLQQVSRWLKLTTLVKEAQDSLSHNPNSKLLLTHLFISL